MLRKKIEVNQGDKYNRLTIVKEVAPYISPKGIIKKKVLCKCDCGNEKEVVLGNLRSGNTTSCGCFNKEMSSEKNCTHGLTNHRLYHTWDNMLARCNNPKSVNYKYYGGRGIAVCDRWLDVKNFIEDMYPTFKDGLTLDRIYNNKGYSKENCKWSTKNEQVINRRCFGKVHYRGVSFNKASNKYKAHVTSNSKPKHIGYFGTALSAAIAYDRYVVENNLDRKLNLWR